MWSVISNVTQDYDAKALKILTERRNKKDLRFVKEIEWQQQLPKGLALPVLEAHTDIESDVPMHFLMPIAETLSNWRGNRKPSQSERITSLTSIATKISELHELGIFHRDIKPNNIFLYEGNWVLGDFGLATGDASNELTEKGDILGSRNYTAPELFNLGESKPNWSKCDVYSFGQLIIWMISNLKNPLGVPHDLSEPTMQLSHYLEDKTDLSVLDHLVARCTHIDPSRRCSMDVVMKELGDWKMVEEEKGLSDFERPRIDLSRLKALGAKADNTIRAKNRWRNEMENLSKGLLNWLEELADLLDLRNVPTLRLEIIPHSIAVSEHCGFQDNYGKKVTNLWHRSSAVLEASFPRAEGGYFVLRGGVDIYLDQTDPSIANIWHGCSASKADGTPEIIRKTYSRTRLQTSEANIMIQKIKDELSSNFIIAYKQFQESIANNY